MYKKMKVIKETKSALCFPEVHFYATLPRLQVSNTAVSR